MAENIRLKDLSTNIKRILELMESHHTEYSSRFEPLKNHVYGDSFNMTFQKKCHIILYKTIF